MKNFSLTLLSVACISLVLSACSEMEIDEEMETENQDTKSYTISILNLSNNQPMSPPAAILHDNKSSVWTIGEAASSSLEMLAEGGDNSALLSEFNDNPQFDATAPLPPGSSISFTMVSRNLSDSHLTIATMLVNSNDAFSGINSVELSQLKAGQSLTVNGYAYDAGTEDNSELAGTMPGPADGGEGFNSKRDDVTSVVSMHGGVVSSDDGYNESALNQSHRFSGLVMKVSITAM